MECLGFYKYCKDDTLGREAVIDQLKTLLKCMDPYIIVMECLDHCYRNMPSDFDYPEYTIPDVIYLGYETLSNHLDVLTEDNKRRIVQKCIDLFTLTEGLINLYRRNTRDWYMNDTVDASYLENLHYWEALFYGYLMDICSLFSPHYIKDTIIESYKKELVQIEE